MRHSSLYFLALSFLALNANAKSKSADEAAIRKTIAQYVEGAVKGDGDLMGKAFSKDAYVYGFMDGESFNGPATNLTAWTSGNIPAKDLKYKIARIDIEGTIATARLELNDWNEREKAKPEAKEVKRKFTDMLMLLKAGDEWKIVGKLFHTHK